MVTFGNRLYDLHAQGEFMLYQSVSLKEQINVLHAFPKVVSMSENEGKVYTDMAVPVGYAFRFGPDVLEIGLKAPRYAEPSFRFNGEMLASIKERHSIGLFTIEREGKVQGSKNDDLLIEVRVPGGARLTVAFSHVDRISRVVGYIEIPGTEMGSTRGMCGSFDMNPQNDFADASGVIQSQPARAAWSWRVQKSDSLFSEMLPKVQEPENFDNFAPTNVTDDADVLQKAFEACRAALKFRKFLFHCTMETAAYGFEAVPLAANVEAIMTADMITVESLDVSKCLEEPGSRMGPWSEWTACSRSCGTGVRSRTRGVYHFDGSSCGEIVDTSACVSDMCPVDCVVAEFGNWTECSVECGTGQMSRTRAILVPSQHGGLSCPSLVEAETCTVTGGCCTVCNYNIVDCTHPLFWQLMPVVFDSWVNGPSGPRALRECRIVLEWCLPSPHAVRRSKLAHAVMYVDHRHIYGLKPSP